MQRFAGVVAVVTFFHSKCHSICIVVVMQFTLDRHIVAIFIACATAIAGERETSSEEQMNVYE